MNVLVVDDDVVSRMVLMHLVDSCGQFQIAEAEDGEDAWRQLAAGLRPAICFCDLRMPRLSGMDLLARVRADGALAALPFVLVSSATDGATVGQAMALGASGYLVKPFDADGVRGQLAALTGAGAAPVALAAEAPAATIARLGIGAERLLAYLGGLQGQLTAASAELGAPDAGDSAAVHERIERLRAGCLTLGLTGAAAALAGAAAGAARHIALADAVRAVMVQSDAVKRL